MKKIHKRNYSPSDVTTVLWYFGVWYFFVNCFIFFLFSGAGYLYLQTAEFVFFGLLNVVSDDKRTKRIFQTDSFCPPDTATCKNNWQLPLSISEAAGYAAVQHDCGRADHEQPADLGARARAVRGAPHSAHPRGVSRARPHPRAQAAQRICKTPCHE